MASTLLSRTPGVAGNRRKWTFSTWVKIGVVGGSRVLFASPSDGTNYNELWFSGSAFRFDQWTSGSSAGSLVTNRLFRDPAAWYNIVCVWDSDNATPGDRMKLYVNGVEETSFSLDTNPAQYLDSYVNSTSYPLEVGGMNAGEYFGGMMAHTHFADGQAYAPTVFGETDSTSGIWVPISAPSVTYGTNGFFLKYASGALGTDSSGEGNNMAVSGTMTNTKDTPNNNFATMTPLNASAAVTLSNGDTTVFGNTTSSGNVSVAICPDTGKWYAECKYATIVSNYPRAGVFQLNDRDFGRLQNSTAGAAGEATNGVQYSAAGAMTTGGSETGSWGSAVSAGGIVQLAIDSDNGAIYIGVNNTWQNSGVPTSGATRTGAATTWTAGPPPTGDSTGTAFGDACYNGSYSNWNFGNGYFGTTAVTSAEADGNGEGQFEYAPPTGYFALCTNNLGSES